MNVLVGALGARGNVVVDEHGVARPVDTPFDLAWGVATDPEWRTAGSAGMRTRSLGGTPVTETAIRMRGGEVRVHWYGAGGVAPCVVLEVENDSPDPCAFAVLVRPVTAGGVTSVRGEGPTTAIGDAAFVSPAAPRRWASASSAEELLGELAAGRASDGPVRVAGASTHVALLFAVPHRVVWRAALVVDRHGGRLPDPARLPGHRDAVAGWDRVLDRGLRVEVPDRTLDDALRLARATILLRAAGSGRHDAQLAAALEDWGFDTEAADVWHRLGFVARRRAARREHAGEPWATVQRARAEPAAEACTLLRAMRETLLAERGRDMEVFPHLPVEWLGAPVAFHDLPTRAGPVSAALRWHGARPALLWDAPRGTVLRAPALDEQWTARTERGEALLRPPPARLLALRTAVHERGAVIDGPGSFL